MRRLLLPYRTYGAPQVKQRSSNSGPQRTLSESQISSNGLRCLAWKEFSWTVKAASIQKDLLGPDCNRLLLVPEMTRTCRKVVKVMSRVYVCDIAILHQYPVYLVTIILKVLQDALMDTSQVLSSPFPFQ